MIQGFPNIATAFQCNVNRRIKFYLFHYMKKLELSVVPRPSFSSCTTFSLLWYKDGDQNTHHDMTAYFGVLNDARQLILLLIQ
jgi:hypothetical protein